MAGLSSNHKQLVDFFESGIKLVYKKGEIIIRPEDKPQGIFIINSGFVKTYTITKYGEENLMVIRNDGDVFPMIWAFTGEYKDVFYEAMTDTILYRVSRKSYLKLINKNPEIAKVVLAMAVEMYRVHAERVNNLEYRTARERLAFRLLSLANQYGKKGKRGAVIIDMPMRHHDLATSVNCTRETASRELSILERKKLIKKEDGQIVIPDTDSLRQLI